MAPVSSKEFLDTQAITEWRFTLKYICDMKKSHIENSLWVLLLIFRYIFFLFWHPAFIFSFYSHSCYQNIVGISGKGGTTWNDLKPAGTLKPTETTSYFNEKPQNTHFKRKQMKLKEESESHLSTSFSL